MKRDLVILGAGGHAKVVIDILRYAPQWTPVGCLDQGVPAGAYVEGVPVWGDDLLLPTLYARGIRGAFVAIGENHLRERLLSHVVALGFELANAISPQACVAASAVMQRGIVIAPGAVVGPATRIDTGAIVNTRASVDHDCVVEACCHVAPGATLAGGVHLEQRVLVGAGATIIPQRRLARDTVVGAGSVVTRDLPAEVVAWGVPARIQRHAMGQRAA